MNKQLIRIEVYNKFEGHCAYCGEKITINQMQIDHIIPKYNFEVDIKNAIHIPERIPKFLRHLEELDVEHIDNKFPSCRVCNNYKRAFNLESFRNELSLQIERANRHSFNYRMAKKYGQVKETIKPIIFYFETLD